MELRDNILTAFHANHFWWNYTTPSSIYINSGPAITLVYVFLIYLFYIVSKKPIRKLLSKLGVKFHDINTDI